MSKIRVFCFSLLIVIVNYSFAGAIDDANEKYDAGEFNLAFSMYEKLASDNDAFAQYRLGSMYDFGEGVVEDKEQAVKWYAKSAEQGNTLGQYSLGEAYYIGEGVGQDLQVAYGWILKSAKQGYVDAQSFLGYLYDYGHGVEQNAEQAAVWYLKAAEQGDEIAQLTIGEMYRDGDGVSENKAEAVKWYTKAAEQGDADAQSSLGWMYDNGEGVLENDKTAVKWYTKAAEQGDAYAQSTLGVMYDNGQGVLENDEEAVKWYTLAAEQGSEDSQYNLGLMYLSGSGVPKDSKLAKKWFALSTEQRDAVAQSEADAYAQSEATEQEDADAQPGLSIVQDDVQVVLGDDQSDKANDSAKSLGEDLELIKAKAKSKKFSLFNNPGKEIARLLSEDKVLEAYYIYKYNISFFDKKELLGKKKNSVKYIDNIIAIANYYYKSDLEDMRATGLSAIKYKTLPDIPNSWPALREITQHVKAVEREAQSNDVSRKLMRVKEEYWKFKADTLWISIKYGYSDGDLIDYFNKYAFTLSSNFFDVYPVELSTYTKNRLLKKAISRMHKKGAITLEMVAKYDKYYDFETTLGSSALSNIRNKKRVDDALQDENRHLYDIVDMAVNAGTSTVLSKLFDTRGLNVQLPQDIVKIPMVIKCSARTCRTTDDAGIRIIVSFEGGESGSEQVGTYTTNIRIKSGTSAVSNPNYNAIARQLDSLRRDIERERRQQQINQQIYSPSTYNSNCTNYGNRINCTTTQAPNDYAIGYQGGAMLAQGINSAFGLKTNEDRYRQLSNQLGRTPVTISKDTYRSQKVAIPEIEITRLAKVTVHIFDVTNKQYLTLPVVLKEKEKWLVPNSAGVHQLPLSSGVKKRLLYSNLVPSKMVQKQTLDLTDVIYQGAARLKVHAYVDPDKVLEAERLVVKNSSKVEANSLEAKEVKLEANPESSSSALSYYELLGDDEFITWAKSDPILTRLLQGFVEGNETAIKVLRGKWLDRQ